MGEGALYIVVVVDDDFCEGGDAFKANILAHECLHATQMIHKFVGEVEPGWEAHAYMLGLLVETSYSKLHEGFTPQTRKKRKKWLGFLPRRS